MYFDIVLPNNNESSFIEMAEKLGYKGLIFLYTYDNFIKNEDKTYSTKKIVLNGIICNKKEIQKSKKISNFVLTIADETDVRNVIEQDIPDGILSFEDNSFNDSLKQRYSGLNNVFCDLIEKQRINICFSLSEIKLKNEEFLGRIIQNIKLSKKHKLSVITGSFASNSCQMKNPKDIISFFVMLGMGEAAAKKSLSNVYSKWKWNKDKAEGKIIADGIEVVS